MSQDTPIVFIVDDDISVRELLEGLVRAEAWRAEAFPSGKAFLARRRTHEPSCLILDLSLPDLNGLDLQKQIAADQDETPIIFISGYGDIPASVQAIKSGALEFLTKPIDENLLLAAVRSAIERSRAALLERARLQSLHDDYATLTSRERQVMALVVAGRLNKQIGGDLDISEITVKAHRGRMMGKMKARSVPDLVRMSSRLGLDFSRPDALEASGRGRARQALTMNGTLRPRCRSRSRRPDGARRRRWTRRRYRSITTSPTGREQQTSRLPVAGGSSGSGA